jgi:son of sevenless
VNTQTGRISRDLPTESDEDVSEGHLTRLPASQKSSSVLRSIGMGFGASSPINAGFGLSNHTEIPEPWVRKLADDGMSYYFTNKQTGQISWTVPRPESLSSRTGRSRAPTKSSTSSSHIRDTNRLRSDSSVSVSGQGSEHSVDRFSLYSDNSETFLIERDRDGSLPVSQQPLINGHRLDWTRNTSPELMDDDAAVMELTAAERSAKSLQQALSPPGPESLADLSAAAWRAIMAVMESIQTNDINRFLEDDTTLDDLVHTVVISIRNLLYVSAAPSGHLPSNTAPGVVYPRDRRNTTASQALLKPAQRKVTATLSKLVLSARAIQYNSGSSIIDTPIRIESDAEELERAVAAFVLEVQRSQNQQLHSAAGLKRLHGVFSTAHIGLGLVGAGAAGSWKGLGWISLEETDEAPGRILGTEVVTELRTYISQIQESFISFRSSIRQLINEPGKSRQSHIYC